MKKKLNRIFITGASGQLAKTFSEIYPKEFLFLATKDKLDVTNKKLLSKQIVEFQPDIIFHFASMTRGDECAKNPKLAFKINVLGTKNVVDVCRKENITLLFVSTNEVFDGEKRTSYNEKDKPNPITVAGSTKYKAENIIKENLEKYYIIRTSWLYSKSSRNFLHAVLEKAEHKKKIDLVVDEISSPTFSLDLCRGIKKLILTEKYGIYHLSNLGEASRLDFAKKAIMLYGIKDIIINPISLDDYKRLSKPPHYSALDNSKIAKLGIKLPGWGNALKRFLKDYEKI